MKKAKDAVEVKINAILDNKIFTPNQLAESYLYFMLHGKCGWQFPASLQLMRIIKQQAND